jgi:formylglycine-generating enzyme
MNPTSGFSSESSIKVTSSEVPSEPPSLVSLTSTIAPKTPLGSHNIGTDVDTKRRRRVYAFAGVVGVIYLLASQVTETSAAARSADEISKGKGPATATVTSVGAEQTTEMRRLLPAFSPTESETDPEQKPSRPWQLISGKHWQMVSGEGEIEPTDVTDQREGNRGSCKPGMVEVKGAMKTHPTQSIDALQLQTCTNWIQKEWPERCAEYDREKWLEIAATLPSKEEHFCMDRFEYPNQKGAYPYVMVSYFESRDMCKAQGKRLCTEEEWTFACEGEEARPYPTGYSRDKTQCVIDEKWSRPKEGSLLPRDTEHAKNEIDRVFHGAASGSARSCASAFGVYDMTGNVDEWTRSSVPGERPSILKGGYFGPVRTRCRPATRAHGEGHIYYQQGFRCCDDAAK